MPVSNFFRRSPKPASSPASFTTTDSASRKSSLELFAEFVGDGDSYESYEFPPLDVLEFDAKPYDSIEVLGEPEEKPDIFTSPTTAPTGTPCPYETNIDWDAELRAEIALFCPKVDDKFVSAGRTTEKQ